VVTSNATPATAARARPARRQGNLRGPLGTTGVVVGAGLIVMSFYAAQYIGSVVLLAFTYAIVTAGMAVQIGFSQQIAFSQSVFMGIGAYGVAVLNTHLNMPSLLATVIVTAASGLVALLLGSVVTRASGLALAVATIMLPLIAVGYLSSAGYLGGSVGMPLTSSLWPASTPQATAVGNGMITVAVIGVVVFVASRILHSDIGLELYVLGVDERTAAAMGVSTPRRKLELFVLGSMFAALGGAVYAGTQLFVPATLVDPTAELSLLMMLFVGGRRSILGAVVGALAIEYVSGASNWVSVNILVVEGVLITVVLLVDPEGLAGIVASLSSRLRRLWRDRRAAPAGEDGEDGTDGPGGARTGRDLCRRCRGRWPPEHRIRPELAGAGRRCQRHQHSPAGVRRGEQGLRRAAGAGCGEPGLARPGPVRAVRPERRGQVHPAGRDRGQRAPGGGPGAAGRHPDHQAAPAAAFPPGPGPDLPDGAPDRWPHRAGQRGRLLPELAPRQHRLRHRPQPARAGQGRRRRGT
jgi:branched-chain amino acid transport system permease protein